MSVERPRIQTLSAFALVAVVGLTNACSSSGHPDSKGDLALESEGVVATWCLHVDKKMTEVDFSHGTEVLTNEGTSPAEILEVAPLKGEAIDVKGFWFADETKGVAGTLTGWPSAYGGDLETPYPLAGGESTNLVVRLTASRLDSGQKRGVSGLHITYRQDGKEHYAETHVGVKLRRQC